jgi:hypothetical protein
MSFSDEPIFPTDPEQPPPTETAAERVRRRRATRRQMIPADTEGQSALVSSLAKRAYPSVELFIFSLLCGAIMGLGFLVDSPYVLLIGALLAPLMTPWVGFLLAIFTGNVRFFLETFMALLISMFLVFIGGLVTGFAARLFMPITLDHVHKDSRLWPAALAVLAIGAVTLVISFVRSESRPYLPSILIAYSFFLPMNAAGFGLGAGLPGAWPEGLEVFSAHFALATVLGLITLFLLRLRSSQAGMIASVLTLLFFSWVMYTLMIGIGISSADAATNDASTPTNQPTPLASATSNIFSTSTVAVLAPETATPNSVQFTETVAVALTQVAQTNNAPTATPTPDTPTPVPLTLAITLPASQTPTITLTIEIQPVSGRINASEGGGANLRQTPNGKYLMTLDNGSLVDVYPDFKQVNGVTWIHVFATRNGQRVEGWLLESVVAYATPEPNFEPSSTPTP